MLLVLLQLLENLHSQEPGQRTLISPYWKVLTTLTNYMCMIRFYWPSILHWGPYNRCLPELGVVHWGSLCGGNWAIKCWRWWPIILGSTQSFSHQWVLNILMASINSCGLYNAKLSVVSTFLTHLILQGNWAYQVVHYPLSKIMMRSWPFLHSRPK